MASSSWKFALLVHPQFLDVGIVDFNVLEFIFTAGASPWTFPPVRIFILVKASHSPSELHCSGMEHAWMHAVAVPIYSDRANSGVGCASILTDFVFISHPVVASIFTL